MNFIREPEIVSIALTTEHLNKLHTFNIWSADSVVNVHSYVYV